tara:strand:+ start:235 stop:669 length:435 start_codon:yes stop_codon:yes gene_type:complete
MANQKVYFHTISNNTIVCVSEPLQTIKQNINGREVTIRKQGNRTFGLLCIVDADGSTMDPRTLGLVEGQPMPGFHFSNSPVIEQSDDGQVEKGQPTGMFWVTATELPAATAPTTTEEPADAEPEVEEEPVAEAEAPKAAPSKKK